MTLPPVTRPAVSGPPPQLPRCRTSSLRDRSAASIHGVPGSRLAVFLASDLIAPVLQVLGLVLDDILVLEVELGAGSRFDRPTATLLGRVLHRLDDVLVPGATAQIALQSMPDLLLGRIRVAIQEGVGGHDHARCAVAALESVHLPKAHLDLVELAIFGDALDGRQFGAVGLDGEQGAALDRVAVHMDDAGATLAGVATDVCASQT